MGHSRLLSMVMALSSLLSACGSLGPNGSLGLGNSITVIAELSSKADALEQKKVRGVLEQRVVEFQRLNPDLKVKLRTLPTQRLKEELQFSTQRGLGPDLLLLTAASDPLTLADKGYISSVNLTPQESRSFLPMLLNRRQNHHKQLALPALMLPLIACFDRRKLVSPPQTLDQIIELGQQGHPIGITASMDGLDWVVSGFGVSMFSQTVSQSLDQSRLLQALQWVRLANLQPDITFVSSDEELRRGLAERRFEWIPCSSGWLPTLRKSLGKDLGISVLPVGPWGPARPWVRVPSWVFGAQSSPSQRNLAMQFVLFNANIVNQRNMSLSLGTVLPVNPAIALPFKAYPDLAIMNTSLKSSTLLSLGERRFISKNSEKISIWIDQIIAGVQSPNALAPRFQQLFDSAPSMEQRK